MDNANIFIFAKTSDWDEEQGNAPRIAILTYIGVRELIDEGR